MLYSVYMYVHHKDDCAECAFCSYTFHCIGVLCKYVHTCACILHAYVKCSIYTHVHIYPMCSMQCVHIHACVLNVCVFYAVGTHLCMFYTRVCVYTPQAMPCDKYIYILLYTLRVWVCTLCTRYSVHTYIHAYIHVHKCVYVNRHPDHTGLSDPRLP